MDDHLLLESFEITEGGRWTSSHFMLLTFWKYIHHFYPNSDEKKLVIFHHKNDNSQLLTIRISGSEILHQRFQST